MHFFPDSDDNQQAAQYKYAIFSSIFMDANTLYSKLESEKIDLKVDEKPSIYMFPSLYENINEARDAIINFNREKIKTGYASYIREALILELISPNDIITTSEDLTGKVKAGYQYTYKDSKLSIIENTKPAKSPCCIL